MGHKKGIIIGTVISLMMILAAAIAIFIFFFLPSNKVMDLGEYYNVKNDEVVVLLQNKQFEHRGLFKDGKVYLDYETVKGQLNKRFYWDDNEKLLSYTTPTEVIRIALNQNSYTVNGKDQKTDYTIAMLQNEQVYVAIEFVKQYSNMEYQIYNQPNRIVIQNDFENEYLYADVTSDTQVRSDASIKSDVLGEVLVGENLIFVDTEEETSDKFTKVMTSKGVIGYVKNSAITDGYFKTLESTFKEPEYTNITSSETINLVWHQVTNQDANNGLTTLLQNTKGVNVVSPTWFSVTSETGEIRSLASSDYVKRAHALGLQVWGLVDDFETSVDKANLLSSTTNRSNLIHNLMSQAKKYKLDGINIDFERVPSAAGEDFIQFIRELSVQCRKNKIVLSIDNYVPAAYNAYYDREEQGIVADYVIIMAYDEHYAGSEESGSVSSISYVTDAVNNTIQQVNKDKVIMALPFYTRLWKEVSNGESVEISSEAYSMKNGIALMEQKGVKLTWLDNIGQHYGEYESDGVTYRMWLEDVKSYELKIQAVMEQEVAGVANWKLGLEIKDIWDVITKYVK